MEPAPIYYDNSMYLYTTKGNKISKQCLIRGTEHIMIEGKAVLQSGTIIRGDLAVIKMGSYVIIREEVVLRPTYTKAKGKLKYVTLNIGDHVFIDRGTIVCAIKIGSNVHIGKNCVIGHRAILKDNCKILDNSVLPADTVVPPFTVYGGRPAIYQGELPETIGMMHKELTMTFFKQFQGVNPKQSQPSGGNLSQTISVQQSVQQTHRALGEQEKQQQKQ